MTNSTRICKVCGAEYPYCKTAFKDGNIFRWQDVACCAEHGSQYFALIAASRGETPAKEAPTPAVDITDDEEEDDLFEEDFDDEDAEEEDE